jgi:hypothetical protein
MYLGSGRICNVINGALAIWHGPSCDRDFSLMQDIPANVYLVSVQYNIYFLRFVTIVRLWITV